MLRVDFDWGSVEVRLDSAIDCTIGIGDTGGHFGFLYFAKEKLRSSDLDGYNCEAVSYIPHVHCTHTESRAHITNDHSGICIVPEFQIAVYESGFPFATAIINPKVISAHFSHILTDKCSIDPEYDNGELKCHHEFFRLHENGFITELCDFRTLKIGIYLLRTAIIKVSGSDAHPTNVLLYPIERMELKKIENSAHQF